MGGVTVTRATDGTHGSSGPAVKKYVDANIAIAPNGVNEVGTAHTFTITVNALPDGASPVVFTSITPSVSPAPDSQDPTSTRLNSSHDRTTCTLFCINNTPGSFT